MLVLTLIVCGVELCNSFVWKYSKSWMRLKWMAWTMISMSCMCYGTTPTLICVSVALCNFLVTVQLQAPHLLLLKLLWGHEWSLIHRSCHVLWVNDERILACSLLNLNPLWKGFSNADSLDVLNSCWHTVWRPIEAMAWLYNGEEGAWFTSSSRSCFFSYSGR